MFFPFSRNYELSGLTPIDIWRIECLVFGVMMASLPQGEVKPDFKDYLATLAEVLGESDLLCNDQRVIFRVGHEAVDAYLFMLNNSCEAKHAGVRWKPTASEMLSYFKEYPVLRDFLKNASSGEVSSNVLL